MKYILRVLILVLLLPQGLNAQSVSKFKKQLKDAVKEIRDSKGKKFVSDLDFADYYALIPADIIKELPQYEKDTLPNVRRLVYAIYYQTGRKSGDAAIRTSAVKALVKGLNDPEPDIRRTNAAKLKLFGMEDFSPEAKELLKQSLKSSKEFYKYSVRFIGFLDMQEQISDLYALLNDTLLKDEAVKWELRITLSRLGAVEQTEYCTDLARSKGVNDHIIHFLLNDLVYTRQKYAFDYLLDILFSDEPFCMPANPYLSDPIVCGYRIMEMLAPVIEDFPFETSKGSTQLKSDNYEQTLNDVRKWFIEHPGYEIKKSGF